MQNEIMIKLDTRPARESSFELLRIIAMVMIVFHHFAIHGGFKWDGLSIPCFWYNFIVMGGKVGVNVFVLISGYFLSGREDPVFNFKKCLKFWGQVFFYSVATCAYGSLITGNPGLKAVIKAFFPITFEFMWFPSTYFVLFLLHPFLNRLIACLDKRLYQKLLVLVVTCWCIIPTVTTSAYQSNLLIWFIVLYAISGYARIYGFNPKLTSRHYFILCGIFTVLTYISSEVLSLPGTNWSIFFSNERYFYGQQKLTILLISLTLFMAFATLKMRNHEWINVIASATFGVYLIHDNEVMRPVLWLVVFRNSQYQDSVMLIPYSIVVVAIVYVMCTLIDLFRQMTVERVYMRLVNTYADSWLKPFQRICEFFERIVFGE